MFTPTRSARSQSFLTFILFLLISLAVSSWTLAQEKDSEAPVGAVGGAVHADLFTGTATTSIPIEVPPGRQGVQPQLALVYGSANGNGWVGMGWKLEKSVIERRTKDGLDYAAEDYVVRLSGINAELVSINTPGMPANTDFRAKIEGSFTRIHKITPPNEEPYFEATDKLGKKYIFGRTAASRLADPSDPSRIFRWCLDRVEDIHGNYMTITYTLDENQGYLAQIDYTGFVGNASQPALDPTNRVIFHLEDLDVENPTGTVNPMYNRIYIDPDPNDPNVDSPSYKTAKRLKTIEVRANTTPSTDGVLQRAYKLEYTPSDHTSRSQLASVQQFGSDADIDPNTGTIGLLVGTTGTGLPPTSLRAMILDTSDESSGDFLPMMGDDHNQSTWATDWKRLPGDYNGDGLTDLCASYTADYLGWKTNCVLSNGDGTFGALMPDNHDTGVWATGWKILPGDYNGDGLTDLCASYTGASPLGWKTNCVLSNGDGTFASIESDLHSGSTWSTSWKILPGDYNGDGLTDLCASYTGASPLGWKTNCVLSNGDGTFASIESDLHSGSTWATDWNILPGDYNGDGLTDLCASYTGTSLGWKTNCVLGQGDGSFGDLQGTLHSAAAGFGNVEYRELAGDFNGDGMTDVCASRTSSAGWRTYCALGKGDGTFEIMVMTSHSTAAGFANAGYRELTGDYNGDGMTDVCASRTSSAGWKTYCAFNTGTKPFLLTDIENGLGGSTTIDYVPSTDFRANHTQLPFPIQVVGAITTDDGNLNVSTTNYTYAGGYFHFAEREFRGFNSALSIGPQGPNGEQTANQTWFHQGNDTAVDVNTPSDPVGYLKGAPYRTQVHALVDDGQGTITPELYLDTTIEYTADDNGAAPYFTPKFIESANICDGDYPNCTATASLYYYDAYGNVTAEVQLGDADPNVTEDDRTVVKTYEYNTDDWLLSFPSSTKLYAGIGAVGTPLLSQADFYYDGTTSCAIASTNQMPTQGLLTRSVNWLDGGTDPETRLAYDAVGNPVCSRDANGNESTTDYDSQKTFEISSTNALSHVASTQYYGVGTVPQDNGLYGQIKQVTDPNNATVSSTYDKLGRVLTVTQPDGFTVTKSYVGLGTVGPQHVQTVNDLGLWSQVYFDGLGREIATASIGTTASNGIDVETIVTVTQYNVRGAVHRTSLPYFLVGGTQLWTTQYYDAMGRVARTEYPDNTVTQKCYNQWESWSIDANDHASYQLRNSLGKPVTVVEYQEYIPAQGETIGCDTNFVPYSTTTYTYDVQGRVLTTTDALLNKISLQYNTLGRKTSMNDPDMGVWTYTHDTVGNIIQQKDAKNQYIYFQYDALNRLRQKDYGTQKTLGSGDVKYTYDTGTNGVGRLSHVEDDSGSTTFYYDIKGQLIQSDKVITGSGTYVTQTSYDGMGRIATSTYPDNSVLDYNYDGPALENVKEGSTTHVGYREYNSQGQAKFVDFANGVTSTYTYNPQNARINTLKTVNGISTTLMNLTYNYDPVGNINSIIDTIRGNQTFVYDAQNRLTGNTGPYGPVNYSYDAIGNMLTNSRVGGAPYGYNASGPVSIRPHAVTSAGGNTYNYDANGNMTDGAGRVLTYDFENRPTQITKASVTTDLVYDGDGGRVMKTAGGVSTIYVGKLYVCEAAICSRMIFAGGQRVAEIETLSGARRYYHTDHLGSTAVVTDNFGNNTQDITYYPFGQAHVNTGADDVRYKFTGKELDSSTDLYFYEARYYDAWLGRFISADTIVPGPFDPQALNRYSYVRNNPVNLTDPSGHSFFKEIASVIGAALIGGPWLGMTVASGVTSDWNIGIMALQQGIALASALTGGVTTVASGGADYLLPTLAGAAVAAATSTALYDLAGYDVDYGQSILTGLVISAVSFGAGETVKEAYQAATKLATGFIASGIEAELSGGDFSMSLMSGFSVSAAGFLGGRLAEITKPIQIVCDCMMANPHEPGIEVILAFTNSAAMLLYLPRTLFRGALGYVAKIFGPKIGSKVVANILKVATKGKGNFGIGSSTRDNAFKAGKEWVGEGYRVSKSGKAWVSKNGLRQFRPPSPKPNSSYGKIQSNFESRSAPKGRWSNNGHLNILD